MKTIELNIGLDTNDGGKVKLHRAYAFTFLHFNVIDSRLDVSPSGETTLVLIIEKPRDLGDFQDGLWKICQVLKQDCIATSEGELIGPNAEKWLPFNPDFFVHFDAKTKDLEIDDWTAQCFVSYLRFTLIPDLLESGSEATAEDFETAAKFIETLK